MTQFSSFTLSLPARESLKAGLAMALTCGLAMGLGWPNPGWACIAVAVVSMPTVGESINKGIHRLLGTILGGVAALVIIGLFPQDRWGFLIGLSIVLGFSAYRMTMSRYVYVWFICGYISVFLASYVPDTSQQIFDTVTARIQETALGVIVYAAVSTLLWPQKSSVDLNQRLAKLLDAQKKCLDGYFSLMLRGALPAGGEALYGTEAQLVPQLRQGLDAAETEQFEIYEDRGWWRRLAGLCEEFMEALETWRESMAELPGDVDIERLFPNLAAFRAALSDHLDSSCSVGEAETGAAPSRVALAIDEKRLAGLPHRQQAVLRNVLHELERIERLAASLATASRMLATPPRERDAKPPRLAAPLSRLPDMDNVAATVRVVVGFWLAAFFWIYIDAPGHMLFIVFVAVNSLLGLLAPVQWAKFIFAESVGIALAGILYVFVMPNLSGYFELAVLLFTLTTGLYYIFWHPRMTMLKMASIMPFLLIDNLQSYQRYDFAYFANSAVAMLLSLTFAGLMSAFPFSQRPEKMFLRVAQRYFRQARGFLDNFGRSGTRKGRRLLESGLVRMRISAGKVGRWAGSVDYDLITANPPEKAAALVGSLNSITYRFKMLADAKASGPPARNYCRAHAGEWEAAIGEAMEPWARGRFADTAAGALRARLPSLEAGSETTLMTLSAEDETGAYAAFSRLLGCYRALYRALIAHAELSTGFDWNNWRESRF